jgi:uncharacterized protein (TIGR02217 family)
MPLLPYTFPVLAGAGWPSREQVQSTVIQETTSGKEVRIQNYPQARYKWVIPFGYLNDDYRRAAADFQILMGFHELVGGTSNPFLVDVLNDNDTSQYVPDPVMNPTPSLIGIGDGVTQDFQIGRIWGGALHWVYYINTNNRAPRIFLGGGIRSSGYTISATGLVHFITPPPSGELIEADFQYYFLARFMEDSIESEAVAGPFHQVRSVTLYETFS